MIAIPTEILTSRRLSSSPIFTARDVRLVVLTALVLTVPEGSSVLETLDLLTVVVEMLNILVLIEKEFVFVEEEFDERWDAFA